MSEIRDILIDLGYRIKDSGRQYRMNPLYRDSSSDSVLSVDKNTGWWTDFKECKSGPIEELIRITKNLSTIEEARKFVSTKYQFEKPKKQEPRLEHIKPIPTEALANLVKDHSYWEGRGVSPVTMKLFEGGMAVKGAFLNRYVFPIFSVTSTGNRKLIGCTGRDTTGQSPIKWKHQGATSKWGYPLQVNFEIIRKENEVIIVESIGDMLALWEAGIKNTLVMFGVSLSPHLLMCLLRIYPDKIIIALNNDGANGAGNKAAWKAKKTLNKHFDENDVIIKLPCKNDFGCMNKKEILEWRNS